MKIIVVLKWHRDEKNSKQNPNPLKKYTFVPKIDRVYEFNTFVHNAPN